MYKWDTVIVDLGFETLSQSDGSGKQDGGLKEAAVEDSIVKKSKLGMPCGSHDAGSYHAYSGDFPAHQALFGFPQKVPLSFFLFTKVIQSKYIILM
jgi:hypothetical protein